MVPLGGIFQGHFVILGWFFRWSATVTATEKGHFLVPLNTLSRVKFVVTNQLVGQNVSKVVEGGEISQKFTLKVMG